MEVQEAGKKWKQLEQDIAFTTQELINEFERETGFIVKNLAIKTVTHEALGQTVSLKIQGVSVDCTLSKN